MCRVRVDARPSRLLLDRMDILYDPIEDRGHALVHWHRLRSGDYDGLIPVASEQLEQLLVPHASEDGRVGDLVAVEMEDRQHGPIQGRIEKRVAVPGGGQRTGFRLAVADHTRDNQIRVIECSSVGVRKGIAELPAFVNRAGRLRRRVARYSTRE